MPRSISPRELLDLIGTPGCPVIVDVRRHAVFQAAPNRIPGAIWRDHLATDSWGRSLAGRRGTVVYCAHGHNVSALAAACLRALDVEVRVLEGGIEAYAEAGGVLVGNSIEGVETGLPRPSVWVTRERPKIDRIACPWLIRRFVDPFAVFHFVPSEWVNEIAQELDAMPFDVAGVFYSHRGESCTFDTMIEAFGLDEPALLHIARIVRGADTARPDLEPEAAGLLAISLGLSATVDDDAAQLDKGMLFYDSLYGWSRHAREERHNWPVPA